MTKTTTVWSKIGKWAGFSPQDDTLPRLHQIDTSPAGAESSSPSAANHTLPARYQTPWRKRQETVQRLEYGYGKILELVESIQHHLTSQDHHSDQLVQSLVDLTGQIKEMPKIAHQQTGALGALTSQVGVSNRHMQVMAEALQDWPQTARAQNEALQTMTEQLHAFSSVAGKLNERLESLDSTVKMLGQTSREQIQTLQCLQQSAQSQENHLTTVLGGQTRRFTLLLVLMLVGVVALATILKWG